MTATATAIHHIAQRHARAAVTVLMLLALALGNAVMGQAQVPSDTIEADSEEPQFNIVREYTEEHPLIYKDYWNLPPYSFINEHGQPDGFNVELVKMLLECLNIPYRIDLKRIGEAYEDMRKGTNDLILSIRSRKREPYGTYGKMPISIFTTSLLTPVSHPLPNVRRVRELGDNMVFVHTGSLALDVMRERDLEGNAIVIEDMATAIKNIARSDSGMVLWNTMTMKYMLRQYGYNNLQLQPIHDLHTDLRFMSRDTVLLERIEQAFLAHTGSPELMQLRQKWFYPETQTVSHPMLWRALWILLVIVSIGVALAYYFYRKERIYAKRHKLQDMQLALYMRTSSIGMWTYDTVYKQFTLFNQDGRTGETIDSATFSRKYHHDDFANMLLMIEQIASSERETRHITVRQHTRPLGSQDTAQGMQDEQQEYLYYDVMLSVLDRDIYGHPRNILGTQTNVTEDRQRHIERQQAALKFRTAFNISNAWLVCFDRQGKLIDINRSACSELSISQPGALIDSGFTIDDLPFDISDAYDSNGVIRELWVSTKIVFDQLRAEGRLSPYILATGTAYHEIIVMPVLAKDKQLMATYVAGLNITDSVATAHESREREREIEHLYSQAQQGMANLSMSLSFAQVRMGQYDPATRTLSFATMQDNEAGETFGPLELVAITALRSRKRIISCFKHLDRREMKNYDFYCHTRLRNTGGSGCRTFSVRVMPIPTPGQPERALRYIILTRDITTLAQMRTQLQAETDKAVEAEQIKNAFLRNMSSEIRRPVEHMLHLSRLLTTHQADPVAIQEATREDGTVLSAEQISNEIHTTCRNLLALVGDILTLSKIEAGMVEVVSETFNMAVLFPALCQMSASAAKRGGLDFQIAAPYEQFMVESDSSIISKIIEGLIRCSIAATGQGFVKVSYEYFNNTLILRVEDSGKGMTQDQIKAISDHRFSRHGGNYELSIKLAIVQEQARLLGGDLYVESQPGHGTTAWVTIPCSTPPISKH